MEFGSAKFENIKMENKGIKIPEEPIPESIWLYDANNPVEPEERIRLYKEWQKKVLDEKKEEDGRSSRC